jgi:hypothetical protein
MLGMISWKALVAYALLPWLLLATPVGSYGQNASENALTRLRSEFEAALARSSVPPLKQRVAELLEVEKRAAAAWDWGTALTAREKRLRAEQELAAAEKLSLLLNTVKDDGRLSGPVQLALSDAKLDGVRLDAARGVLTDWAAAGSKATWKLPDLSPGGYEVVLRYTSSATQGGTVRVQEQFYSLTADTHITLHGPEQHLIGTLRVRSGSGPLVVSALKISKGGLMELSAVELVPVNE